MPFDWEERIDHITPVLASLHWLPISFRIQFKILLLVFKSLHGLAPQYLSELLHPHAPVRAMRSTHQMISDVPRCRRKNRGDRAFVVAAPNMWNSQPLNIRAAQSIEDFKSLLKTPLFTLSLTFCLYLCSHLFVFLLCLTHIVILYCL